MTESPNQLVADELTALAKSLNVTIEPKQFDRIANWQVDRLKKVWFPGIWSAASGQPVIIKFLPTGSVTSREEFIRTESVAAQINHHLKQSGLPVQETLKYDFNHQPPWSLLTYLPGSSIGSIAINQAFLQPALLAYLTDVRQKLNSLGTQLDLSQLNQPDFQKKWQTEFAQRRHLVSLRLGEPAAKLLEEILNQPIQAPKPNRIIHNDLAPENILEHNGRFSIIDWGEAAIGWPVIDWIMVWVFSLAAPEFQKSILKQMFSECQTRDELDLARQLAVMLVSRMIATFAERADYYQPRGQLYPELQAQSIENLNLVWHRFQELQEVCR